MKNHFPQLHVGDTVPEPWTLPNLDGTQIPLFAGKQDHDDKNNDDDHPPPRLPPLTLVCFLRHLA
jgi:hypothetical protein